ncbi:hypothetical protein ACTFIR_007111 [Dictyostelium discoideum]
MEHLLNRFFELQIQNIDECGDYLANDKMLISILNHFKTKYLEDYYSQCSKLDFKENKKLFSNDFVCNNYQDFKENILKCNIDNPLDFFPVLKLNQFIVILESTPPQQNYSCLSNPEILAWIYENRECDLKSGRCTQPNIVTLFRYLFYTNQFSKALNDIDYFNNPGDIDYFKFKNDVNDENILSLKKVIKAMKSKKEFKQEQIDEFNTIIKITLLLINSGLRKLLKSIIKSNNFNYLEILYNYINNTSKEKKFENLLEELKDLIFEYIKKYNKISCLKLLFKLDQDKSFFSEDILKYFYFEINTNYSINQEISNIKN